MQIDGRQMTIAEFQAHVDSIELRPWHASAVCIHNTGAPDLKSWMSYPVKQRLLNIKDYYERAPRFWKSGPHLFIDPNPNGIILFTPLNQQGTHSPSFNGTHIGIECVGNYDKDDDDIGLGQEMKKNLIAALAILHGRYGWDPAKIAMHKDDPRTTHDCPGRDLYEDRAKIIQMTREWMGHGGEHPPVLVIDGTVPPAPIVRRGATNTGDLNLRENSSAGSRSLGKLPKGTALKILGDTMNGGTKWLQVETPRGYGGWVAARFVNIF